MFVGSAVWVLWGATASAGTLAGTVFARDGAPVEGATVEVFGPGAVVASTLSEADGTWRIEGLRDDRYRVLATPPADAAEAGTWAPAASDRCAADAFDVSADAEATVDVELLPGTEISGVLMLPDGTPAAGAVVTVEPETDATPRKATTGEDGAFVVRGLPAAGVLIHLDAPQAPVQYWGAEFDRDSAWVLTLELERSIDLGPVTLLEGGSIGGRVSGPYGPVDTGDVVLVSEGQRITVPIGSDGMWKSTRLPPGSVLVSANVPGLAETFWPDLDRPGERITVAGGERVDGIDLELVAESRVRGALAGAPWYAEGAAVVLHNDDDTIALGASINTEGTFQYTRLQAGDYTLWLDGTANDRLPGFLADEQGEPRIVSVAPGEILELGALELPPAGRIEGTVTDRATGEPVVGAYVIASPTSTGGLGSSSTASTGGEEVVAHTDFHGWFALRGLSEGAWEVRAGYDAPCPTDREWVTQWHPGTPNDLFASRVDVVPGESATWAARLPPDEDHDAMDDVWESKHQLDPTVDDANQDPDEDGFDNLSEYLLDTDPTERSRRAPTGCGCAGGGPMTPLVALLAPLLVRRRGRSSGAR